jgi:hypothetical protein
MGTREEWWTDSVHPVVIASPQIIDMSTSKTGKHGHAKVHLVATDVSTPTLAPPCDRTASLADDGFPVML